MKIKLLFAMLVGAAITASAQGYKDGVEYYKAGQYDNAIELLERNMATAGEGKALAQYYLGQAYLAKDDVAKAKAAFDAGVATDPNCAYNYVGLGAIQLKNNQAQAAKENFKKAGSLAKKNAEVRVDIARAYFNTNPDLYAKDIEENLKQARKDSKLKEPSIYVFEGDRLAKAQDWDGAATQYEQAIYFDEDNPEGYVKYANVYYYINPEYATGKLDELLKRKPNSALAQRELAEKYYLNGKWTRAAQQYGKYIANPNHFPQDKARYAVLLYAGANYKDAVDVSREVLATDPTNFQAQRVLVRSLAELKDNAQAIAAGRKFMKNPEFAGRYNASDYTTMYSLLKDDSLTRPEALGYLEAGVTAMPDNATLLYEMSDFYFDEKNYPMSADYAEKYLAKAPELNPGDYYSEAIKFLGATMGDDSVAAADYGRRGVAIMDKAMEGLDLGSTPPQYFRRKALISTAGNGNQVDKVAYEAWQNLVKRMDMDPSYADPNNPKNMLEYYVQAYNGIAKYETEQGNTEAADAAKEQQAKYSDLLHQVPTAE